MDNDNFEPEDLAWFRRPLRALLLAATVSACAEPPAHTLGDAAREVAYSLCDRWISCEVAGGEPVTDYQRCVDDLAWDFCNDVLDLGLEGVSCARTEYPEWSWERLVRCTEFYSELSCSVYAEPCALEPVWQ